MISLPRFVFSSVSCFDSNRISSNPRKLMAISAGYAASAILIFTAWSIGQAQQLPQVLHSHVRSVVSQGKATVVGLLPPDQLLNLSIVLPLRNQAELTSLLGRLYDPSSPDYRHFLSVDQFTEQFGPTVEDYEAVVSFAEANGFVVTDRPANRLVVPISGSVAQINRAFNLKMSVYQHPTEDRTFFSPNREPSFKLSVPVAHIAGLNDFSLPHPMLEISQEGVQLASVTGSGPGGSYLGSDMRAAYYGGTTLSGNGQTVGLLEFGGYNLSDVNSTFSNAGQPTPSPLTTCFWMGPRALRLGTMPNRSWTLCRPSGWLPA